MKTKELLTKIDDELDYEYNPVTDDFEQTNPRIVVYIDNMEVHAEIKNVKSTYNGNIEIIATADYE